MQAPRCQLHKPSSAPCAFQSSQRLPPGLESVSDAMKGLIPNQLVDPACVMSDSSLDHRPAKRQLFSEKPEGPAWELCESPSTPNSMAEGTRVGLCGPQPRSRMGKLPRGYGGNPDKASKHAACAPATGRGLLPPWAGKPALWAPRNTEEAGVANASLAD